MQGLYPVHFEQFASQALQDAPSKDLREGRNAAENIVPTTTGATVAAALVVPELKGIFQGLSVRVPTPVVSLSDFTFLTDKHVTINEVNDVLKTAAARNFVVGAQRRPPLRKMPRKSCVTASEILVPPAP